MSDVRYLYNDTADGMFCCLYECLAARRIPAEILPQPQADLSFYEEIYVPTDPARAEKMRTAIRQRISPYALRLAEEGFLCACEGNERLILDFVRLGLHFGARVTGLAGNPVVDRLQKAVQALHREAHQYLGFVRFSEYDRALCAEIEPKNQVLGLIAPHFCARYPQETLMIFDRTHRQLLVCARGQARILPVERFDWQPADAEETRYRALWKLFYDTVAIPERENPRCRLSHMPKRYWNHLTEQQEQTRPA